MYRFQALQDIGLPELAECFNLAFSDYEQPISFTEESLKYYLTASAVDLSLSFGAFSGEKLVGFILNSGGVYHGQRVVFDAGTGVIPEHRGKKVFSELFAYTVERLQDKGIASYYLEVLHSNHHAQSIYRKVGFSIRREFAVLAATGSGQDWDGKLPVMPYQDFAAFETEISVAPSFEHTTHTINRNPHLYEVLYLSDRAYCVYAKRNGAIIQMHYNDPEGLKEVLSALIRQYPKAWAKNVDCNCRDVMQVLTELGFTEITKQYEMARDI